MVISTKSFATYNSLLVVVADPIVSIVSERFHHGGLIQLGYIASAQVSDYILPVSLGCGSRRTLYQQSGLGFPIAKAFLEFGYKIPGPPVRCICSLALRMPHRKACSFGHRRLHQG